MDQMHNPQGSQPTIPQGAASGDDHRVSSLQMQQQRNPQQQQQQLETDSRSAISPATGLASHEAASNRCQVDGCKADLQGLKRYFRRYHVCESHMRSQEVSIGGIRKRFCDQCSTFHILTFFDGNRRTCRDKLQQNREKRRARKAQNSGGADNATPIMGGSPAANLAAAMAAVASASAAGAGSGPCNGQGPSSQPSDDAQSQDDQPVNGELALGDGDGLGSIPRLVTDRGRNRKRQIQDLTAYGRRRLASPRLGRQASHGELDLPVGLNGGYRNQDTPPPEVAPDDVHLGVMGGVPGPWRGADGLAFLRALGNTGGGGHGWGDQRGGPGVLEAGLLPVMGGRDSDGVGFGASGGTQGSGGLGVGAAASGMDGREGGVFTRRAISLPVEKNTWQSDWQAPLPQDLRDQEQQQQLIFEGQAVATVSGSDRSYPGLTPSPPPQQQQQQVGAMLQGHGHAVAGLHAWAPDLGLLAGNAAGAPGRRPHGNSLPNLPQDQSPPPDSGPQVARGPWHAAGAPHGLSGASQGPDAANPSDPAAGTLQDMIALFDPLVTTVHMPEPPPPAAGNPAPDGATLPIQSYALQLHLQQALNPHQPQHRPQQYPMQNQPQPSLFEQHQQHQHQHPNTMSPPALPMPMLGAAAPAAQALNGLRAMPHSRATGQLVPNGLTNQALNGGPHAFRPGGLLSSNATGGGGGALPTETEPLQRQGLGGNMPGAAGGVPPVRASHLRPGMADTPAKTAALRLQMDAGLLRMTARGPSVTTAASGVMSSILSRGPAHGGQPQQGGWEPRSAAGGGISTTLGVGWFGPVSRPTPPTTTATTSGTGWPGQRAGGGVGGPAPPVFASGGLYNTTAPRTATGFQRSLAAADDGALFAQDEIQLAVGGRAPSASSSQYTCDGDAAGEQDVDGAMTSNMRAGSKPVQLQGMMPYTPPNLHASVSAVLADPEAKKVIWGSGDVGALDELAAAGPDLHNVSLSASAEAMAAAAAAACQAVGMVEGVSDMLPYNGPVNAHMGHSRLLQQQQEFGQERVLPLNGQLHYPCNINNDYNNHVRSGNNNIQNDYNRNTFVDGRQAQQTIQQQGEQGLLQHRQQPQPLQQALYKSAHQQGQHQQGQQQQGQHQPEQHQPEQHQQGQQHRDTAQLSEPQASNLTRISGFNSFVNDMHRWEVQARQNGEQAPKLQHPPGRQANGGDGIIAGWPAVFSNPTQQPNRISNHAAEHYQLGTTLGRMGNVPPQYPPDLSSPFQNHNHDLDLDLDDDFDVPQTPASQRPSMAPRDAPGAAFNAGPQAAAPTTEPPLLPHTHNFTSTAHQKHLHHQPQQPPYLSGEAAAQQGHGALRGGGAAAGGGADGGVEGAGVRSQQQQGLPRSSTPQIMLVPAAQDVQRPPSNVAFMSANLDNAPLGATASEVLFAQVMSSLQASGTGASGTGPASNDGNTAVGEKNQQQQQQLRQQQQHHQQQQQQQQHQQEECVASEAEPENELSSLQWPALSQQQTWNLSDGLPSWIAENLSMEGSLPEGLSCQQASREAVSRTQPSVTERSNGPGAAAVAAALRDEVRVAAGTASLAGREQPPGAPQQHPQQLLAGSAHPQSNPGGVQQSQPDSHHHMQLRAPMHMGMVAPDGAPDGGAGPGVAAHVSAAWYATALPNGALSYGGGGLEWYPHNSHHHQLRHQLQHQQGIPYQQPRVPGSGSEGGGPQPGGPWFGPRVATGAPGFGQQQRAPHAVQTEDVDMTYAVPPPAQHYGGGVAGFYGSGVIRDGGHLRGGSNGGCGGGDVGFGEGGTRMAHLALKLSHASREQVPGDLSDRMQGMLRWQTNGAATLPNCVRDGCVEVLVEALHDCPLPALAERLFGLPHVSRHTPPAARAAAARCAAEQLRSLVGDPAWGACEHISMQLLGGPVLSCRLGDAPELLTWEEGLARVGLTCAAAWPEGLTCVGAPPVLMADAAQSQEIVVYEPPGLHYVLGTVRLGVRMAGEVVALGVAEAEVLFPELHLPPSCVANPAAEGKSVLEAAVLVAEVADDEGKESGTVVAVTVAVPLQAPDCSASRSDRSRPCDDARLPPTTPSAAAGPSCPPSGLPSTIDMDSVSEGPLSVQAKCANPRSRSFSFPDPPAAVVQEAAGPSSSPCGGGGGGGGGAPMEPLQRSCSGGGGGGAPLGGVEPQPEYAAAEGSSAPDGLESGCRRLHGDACPLGGRTDAGGAVSAELPCAFRFSRGVAVADSDHDVEDEADEEEGAGGEADEEGDEEEDGIPATGRGTLPALPHPEAESTSPRPPNASPTPPVWRHSGTEPRESLKSMDVESASFLSADDLDPDPEPESAARSLPPSMACARDRSTGTRKPRAAEPRDRQTLAAVEAEEEVVEAVKKTPVKQPTQQLLSRSSRISRTKSTSPAGISATDSGTNEPSPRLSLRLSTCSTSTNTLSAAGTLLERISLRTDSSWSSNLTVTTSTWGAGRGLGYGAGSCDLRSLYDSSTHAADTALPLLSPAAGNGDGGGGIRAWRFSSGGGCEPILFQSGSGHHPDASALGSGSGGGSGALPLVESGDGLHCVSLELPGADVWLGPEVSSCASGGTSQGATQSSSLHPSPGSSVAHSPSPGLSPRPGHGLQGAVSKGSSRLADTADTCSGGGVVISGEGVGAAATGSRGLSQLWLASPFTLAGDVAAAVVSDSSGGTRCTTQPPQPRGAPSFTFRRGMGVPFSTAAPLPHAAAGDNQEGASPVAIAVASESGSPTPCTDTAERSPAAHVDALAAERGIGKDVAAADATPSSSARVRPVGAAPHIDGNSSSSSGQCAKAAIHHPHHPQQQLRVRLPVVPRPGLVLLEVLSGHCVAAVWPLLVVACEQQRQEVDRLWREVAVGGDHRDAEKEGGQAVAHDSATAVAAQHQHPHPHYGQVDAAAAALWRSVVVDLGLVLAYGEPQSRRVSDPPATPLQGGETPCAAELDRGELPQPRQLLSPSVETECSPLGVLMTPPASAGSVVDVEEDDKDNDSGLAAWMPQHRPLYSAAAAGPTTTGTITSTPRMALQGRVPVTASSSLGACSQGTEAAATTPASPPQPCRLRPMGRTSLFDVARSSDPDGEARDDSLYPASWGTGLSLRTRSGSRQGSEAAGGAAATAAAAVAAGLDLEVLTREMAGVRLSSASGSVVACGDGGEYSSAPTSSRGCGDTQRVASTVAAGVVEAGIGAPAGQGKLSVEAAAAVGQSAARLRRLLAGRSFPALLKLVSEFEVA